MKALAPHWGALLALALFLAAGFAVLDDYGVTGDEQQQRAIAVANARYAAGDRDALYGYGVGGADHLYGVAFEAPLLLVERAFRLGNSRGVHLSRHLLMHLFFLTGGLFAYLLARRLSGNSLVGLFAMLIFLLHPRLYAHSFFNSKDIPFLVAFVIALYLAHRAFKRDTLLAFALLGVGVGVAVNLRIMGVVLLAAIPALLALDLAFAPSWRERKRALLAAGAFALAAGLAFFTLLPHLWADPVGRVFEWWTTSSDHPEKSYVLFRGLNGRSVEFPEYIPVWFSITTPPFALLLGLIGAALILLRAVKAPREALRNTRLRFGLLLAGCFTTPILAVVLLDANIHHDWRHVYFLWAPFALLAALGLQSALALRRAIVYGTAGLCLVPAVVSMALIHPNQQLYFNFSVDRVTPEYLRSQYTMDYWFHSMRQALEWLADKADFVPGQDAVIAGGSYWGDDFRAGIAPDAARERVAEIKNFRHVEGPWAWSARPLHRVRVYDNTMLTIEGKDDLREVYAATRGRDPDVATAFDVHHMDGSVALVMEPCASTFLNARAALRVTPVDTGDLPPWREGKMDEARGFPLAEYGAFFDGKCVASLPLPGYPIAEIRLVWRPELLARETAREAMRRAKEEGRLLARSVYDVYLANGELVYTQEQCDPPDTRHPFRVSVFSERADGSSERQSAWGRETRVFEFHERGALLEDGACVALFPLPDYPVAGIQTEQYAEGGDDLWSMAFSANPERYEAAYRFAGSEPLARGAFDVHLLDGDLVYVKEPCEQADTDAGFFLHVVPDRVSDLPENRREHGFDNLDFRFFLNGAWFDGRCAARVPLPSYPIASIRTGQFSGVGEIWSAEFAVGRPLHTLSP